MSRKEGKRRGKGRNGDGLGVPEAYLRRGGRRERKRNAREGGEILMEFSQKKTAEARVQGWMTKRCAGGLEREASWKSLTKKTFKTKGREGGKRGKIRAKKAEKSKNTVGNVRETSESEGCQAQNRATGAKT